MTEAASFAADRMYDAIRAMQTASTPSAYTRAVDQCEQAADDYDAALSQVELDDQQRTRIYGLARPHDVGRN